MQPCEMQLLRGPCVAHLVAAPPRRLQLVCGSDGRLYDTAAVMPSDLSYTVELTKCKKMAASCKQCSAGSSQGARGRDRGARIWCRDSEARMQSNSVPFFI